LLEKNERAESELTKSKEKITKLKKDAKQEIQRLEKTLSSEHRERKGAEKRNKELESYIHKLNKEKDESEQEKKIARQRYDCVLFKFFTSFDIVM
jgi:hypothetical protein